MNTNLHSSTDLANALRNLRPDEEAAITTVARARFFRGGPVEARRVKIEPDGCIRVWDDVAGHYTLMHSLSERTRRRIVRDARATQDDAQAQQD